MTRQTMITLYGNVGADPETRNFPGKEITADHYDPIIDEIVTRDYTTQDRELKSFSIAVTGKVKKGKKVKEITRWIRCDDWNGLTTSMVVRKGDRVKVRGYFRERSYEKDGERKTAKNFIVQDLSIERRRKAPQQA